MLSRAGLSVLVLAAFAVPGVNAIHQVKSLYTVVDLSECKRARFSAAVDVRVCEGLPGYPVYIARSARKTFLSVGANAASSLAAKQTLPPTNSIFEPGSKRTTVEWRFIIRNDKPIPYATIVRYFTGEGRRRGEVLVVMRVSDREVCHVAYVDALANADAMILARGAADTHRRENGCPTTPAILGETGKSPL